MELERRAFLRAAGAALAAPAVLRPGRAYAADVTLRLHHFLPPVSNAHVNFLVPWAKKVESDSQGRIIVYDSYYAVQDKGTVVHEALHVYLNNINSPYMGEANEAWVDEWEATCAK